MKRFHFSLALSLEVPMKTLAQSVPAFANASLDAVGPGGAPLAGSTS